MDLPASEPAAGDFPAAAGNLSAATGGAAPHHALQLMQELADAASPGGAAGAAADGEAGEARVVAAIEAAIGLAPGDPLEAMLITQMAACHAAAMRCLGRAADCADRPQTEALYLRLAARLMNLFVRQAGSPGPPRETDRQGGKRGGGRGDGGGNSGTGRRRHPRQTPRRHLRAPPRGGGAEDRGR